MLHVADLSHVSIVEENVALNTAVEVNMEATRLVEARVGNIEEVVIRQKCISIVGR